MKPKVGLITIGQSPRPDIINEMKKVLGKRPEIIEAGALDGLSKEEVLSLISSSGPSEQGYLVTRLQDGTVVTIPKEHIVKRIGAVLPKLESQQVRTAAILCVGDFPEYPFDGILLRPGKLIMQLVSSFHQKGKGVVVIPLEEERYNAITRWNLSHVDAKIKVLLSGSDSETIERLSEEIKEEDPAFVILECMGYGENIKRSLKKRVNCPVILPKKLLGCTLKEML